MATTAAAPKKKEASKTRVVKGIEHGLSGYTNYGCRCDVCKDANRDHSRKYREKRFAGSPLCIVPKCQHRQSRSYGNGLCYGHARALLQLRKTKPKKWSRIMKQLGVQVR